MRGVADPGSVGRILLGVRYSQPPQPTAHHDTLTFHSTPAPADPASQAVSTAFGVPSNTLYMNAQSGKDGVDSEQPVQGELCQPIASPGKVTYCWNVPLSPGLQLGLDVDGLRQGSLDLPIKTTLPMQGTVLTGELDYFAANYSSQDGGGRPTKVLATLKPTAATDIGPNSDTILKTAVVPDPKAGYTPFILGAAMQLTLSVTFTRVDGFGFGPHDAPAIKPGGQIQLPLNEYHDRVDTLFLTSSNLAWVAGGAQDRLVNPGKTVLFNLTLMNRGPKESLVDLQMTGTHLDWARLLPLGQLRIPAGANRTVQVSVKAPATATENIADRGADLLLSATGADDLNERALARLVATIDTKVQHPDEAGAYLPAKHGAPALDSPLLLTALLALGLRRRRAPKGNIEVAPSVPG
jgi:hypothetical protein